MPPPKHFPELIERIVSPGYYICFRNVIDVEAFADCKGGVQMMLNHKLKIDNSNIELWYPRGYGDQKLYKFQVTAMYRAGNSEMILMLLIEFV